MSTAILEEFKALSTPDKIRLVEQLWDVIAESGEEIPLTPEQSDELDRRIAEHEANPGAGTPWEEVKARILARSHRG